MTVETPTLPLAVLDTSFWALAYRAEVAANCLDLFRIIVPRAVEAEIRSTQADAPRREYPYATLFRHLRDKMIDPPPDAPTPLNRFGAGEAAAIPLAESLGAHLLINERPAATYALALGLIVVRVSDVVVALRLGDVISDRAARRKLDLIRANTERAIVDEARRVLDRFSQPDASDTDQPESH